MLALLRAQVCLSCVLLFTSTAVAQVTPRPPLKGHKMRIKIDSSPQQAAIYRDGKEFGIEGYTPSTLMLPKGQYKIILELPGFQAVEKTITVTKSQAFVFTMERAVRPAVLDVRGSQANDSAVGGQLFVDGAPVGTVPARVEVAQGHHLIEVKKPGFNDYRDSADLNEGEQRTMVVELIPQVKKGALLVTADVAGADVWVDGTRRDAAPALIGDLPEGPHTVEVRKDPLPPWKQVVQVIGGQQVKVSAGLQAAVPQTGSIRVVSSTPGAEVVVDGEPKGPTNTEIPNLKPGQHIVEVRAKGFASQVVEQQVVPGEQRIAKIDLQPQVEKPVTARLRVVTPVPDAEVFVDGASMGKAPLDRSDFAPGKHFVVVRKSGFAEWKRQVDLDPASPVTLSAELSASGTLKILSNVAGATISLDGQVVGNTPFTLENVAAGDHLLEVKKTGYVDARQSVHIDGGEQKILAADLAAVRTGPSAADLVRRHRSMSSFSAVTIDPARFTADVGGGYVPFGFLRLTVGAFRIGGLGMDTGVELRTTGYFTDGGVHAKLQVLQAGPFALAGAIFIGGGGGPKSRSDFTFEAGIPMTLLFGEIVRFTIHPYVQVYTDRNCAAVDDILANGGKSSDQYANEESSCKAKDGQRMGKDIPAATPADLKTGPIQNPHQDPRDRFTEARFMLRAALEIAVHEAVNIFIIFEGDPIGERQSLTDKFSSAFPRTDPQIYGGLGATFKF
jgi:hypothetical protein